MKDYIEERAVEIAHYIIETKATVRQTAKKFGISKSTVHKDVTDRLIQINPAAPVFFYKVTYSVSKFPQTYFLQNLLL